MDVLTLSSPADHDHAYYRERWTLFYTERRRLLTRLLWLAGGVAICFLLFGLLVDLHPRIAQIIAVPLTLLLLALPVQWFVFVWKMRSWTCPRCAERFFTSTMVNNPFGRHCRHCGLVRPRRSEIKDPFNFEDVAKLD
jgi:hypothetical protein